jgi:ATP-dependent RNA helicase DDX49/DBP8
MKQALECSRRPHIIIATPGRLADLIKSSPDAIHISRIKFLVLDEADRLLTAPFAPDLSTIFDSIPKTRQTLLFTATMTEPVLKLCENKENPPFVHLCKSDVSTVSTLKQHYIFVPGYVREAYLIALITQPKLDSLTKIIFVAKCSTCELLKLMLIELGYKAVSLHSEMNQTDRINSLGRFRSGVAKILIATDVASRGLDIPSVQLVVNYELPRDPAEYIHRVGRTARAGRGGKAVSIVAENDVKLVHAIEEKVNIKMDEFPIKEDDVVNVLNKVSDAKRVAKVTMHDTQFGEKRRIQKMKREKLAVLRGEKKPKLKN